MKTGNADAECPKREEGRRPERNATILPNRQPHLPVAAFAKNNTACVKRGGEWSGKSIAIVLPALPTA